MPDPEMVSLLELFAHLAEQSAKVSPVDIVIYEWVPKACALNAHVRRLASWVS